MIRLPETIRGIYKKLPPKEWPDPRGELLNRKRYLTASEASKCIRRLYFEKNHVQVNGTDWSDLTQTGYAERGHAVEAWVSKFFTLYNEMYNNAQGVFRFFGDDQVSFTYKGLSCTPDALYTTKHSAWNVEIKSFDPRKNPGNIVQDSHITQVKMGQTILANNNYNVRGSILLYVNASNFNEMMQEDLEFDAYFEEWALDRRDQLFAAPGAYALPAEGTYMSEGCKYCAFTNECNDVERQRARTEEERTIENAWNTIRGR